MRGTRRALPAARARAVELVQRVYLGAAWEKRLVTPRRECEQMEFVMSFNILEGAVIDDRFRLVRRLGSGGMGEVWLAHHAALDMLCALPADSGAEPRRVVASTWVDLLEGRLRQPRAREARLWSHEASTQASST